MNKVISEDGIKLHLNPAYEALIGRLFLLTADTTLPSNIADRKTHQFRDPHPVD